MLKRELPDGVGVTVRDARERPIGEGVDRSGRKKQIQWG